MSALTKFGVLGLVLFALYQEKIPTTVVVLCVVLGILIARKPKKFGRIWQAWVVDGRAWSSRIVKRIRARVKDHVQKLTQKQSSLAKHGPMWKRLPGRLFRAALVVLAIFVEGVLAWVTVPPIFGISTTTTVEFGFAFTAIAVAAPLFWLELVKERWSQSRSLIKVVIPSAMLLLAIGLAIVVLYFRHLMLSATASPAAILRIQYLINGAVGVLGLSIGIVASRQLSPLADELDALSELIKVWILTFFLVLVATSTGLMLLLARLLGDVFGLAIAADPPEGPDPVEPKAEDGVEDEDADQTRTGPRRAA